MSSAKSIRRISTALRLGQVARESQGQAQGSERTPLSSTASDKRSSFVLGTKGDTPKLQHQGSLSNLSAAGSPVARRGSLTQAGSPGANPQAQTPSTGGEPLYHSSEATQNRPQDLASAAQVAVEQVEPGFMIPKTKEEIRQAMENQFNKELYPYSKESGLLSKALAELEGQTGHWYEAMVLHEHQLQAYLVDGAGLLDTVSMLDAIKSAAHAHFRFFVETLQPIPSGKDANAESRKVLLKEMVSTAPDVVNLSQYPIEGLSVGYLAQKMAMARTPCLPSPHLCEPVTDFSTLQDLACRGLIHFRQVIEAQQSVSTNDKERSLLAPLFGAAHIAIALQRYDLALITLQRNIAIKKSVGASTASAEALVDAVLKQVAAGGGEKVWKLHFNRVEVLIEYHGKKLDIEVEEQKQWASMMVLHRALQQYWLKQEQLHRTETVPPQATAASASPAVTSPQREEGTPNSPDHSVGDTVVTPTASTAPVVNYIPFLPKADGDRRSDEDIKKEQLLCIMKGAKAALKGRLCLEAQLLFEDALRMGQERLNALQPGTVTSPSRTGGPLVARSPQSQLEASQERNVGGTMDELGTSDFSKSKGPRSASDFGTENSVSFGPMVQGDLEDVEESAATPSPGGRRVSFPAPSADLPLDRSMEKSPNPKQVLFERDRIGTEDALSQSQLTSKEGLDAQLNEMETIVFDALMGLGAALGMIAQDSFERGSKEYRQLMSMSAIRHLDALELMEDRLQRRRYGGDRKKKEDLTICSVLLPLGIISSNLALYDESLHFFERSLKIRTMYNADSSTEMEHAKTILPILYGRDEGVLQQAITAVLEKEANLRREISADLTLYAVRSLVKAAKKKLDDGRFADAEAQCSLAIVGYDHLSMMKPGLTRTEDFLGALLTMGTIRYAAATQIGIPTAYFTPKFAGGVRLTPDMMNRAMAARGLHAQSDSIDVATYLDEEALQFYRHSSLALPFYHRALELAEYFLQEAEAKEKREERRQRRERLREASPETGAREEAIETQYSAAAQQFLGSGKFLDTPPAPNLDPFREEEGYSIYSFQNAPPPPAARAAPGTALSPQTLDDIDPVVFDPPAGQPTETPAARLDRYRSRSLSCRATVASILYNLGCARFHLRMYAAAIDYFTKARNMRKLCGDDKAAEQCDRSISVVSTKTRSNFKRIVEYWGKDGDATLRKVLRRSGRIGNDAEEDVFLGEDLGVSVSEDPGIVELSERWLEEHEDLLETTLWSDDRISSMAELMLEAEVPLVLGVQVVVPEQSERREMLEEFLLSLHRLQSHTYLWSPERISDLASLTLRIDIPYRTRTLIYLPEEQARSLLYATYNYLLTLEILGAEHVETSADSLLRSVGVYFVATTEHRFDDGEEQARHLIETTHEHLLALHRLSESHVGELNEVEKVYERRAIEERESIDRNLMGWTESLIRQQITSTQVYEQMFQGKRGVFQDSLLVVTIRALEEKEATDRKLMLWDEKALRQQLYLAEVYAQVFQSKRTLFQESMFRVTMLTLMSRESTDRDLVHWSESALRQQIGLAEVHAEVSLAKQQFFEDSVLRVKLQSLEMEEGVDRRLAAWGEAALRQQIGLTEVYSQVYQAKRGLFHRSIEAVEAKSRNHFTTLFAHQRALLSLESIEHQARLSMDAEEAGVRENLRKDHRDGLLTVLAQDRAARILQLASRKRTWRLVLKSFFEQEELRRSTIVLLEHEEHLSLSRTKKEEHDRIVRDQSTLEQLRRLRLRRAIRLAGELLEENERTDRFAITVSETAQFQRIVDHAREDFDRRFAEAMRVAKEIRKRKRKYQYLIYTEAWERAVRAAHECEMVNYQQQVIAMPSISLQPRLTLQRGRQPNDYSSPTPARGSSLPPIHQRRDNGPTTHKSQGHQPIQRTFSPTFRSVGTSTSPRLRRPLRATSETPNPTVSHAVPHSTVPAAAVHQKRQIETRHMLALSLHTRMSLLSEELKRLETRAALDYNGKKGSSPSPLQRSGQGVSSPLRQPGAQRLSPMKKRNF